MSGLTLVLTDEPTDPCSDLNNLNSVCSFSSNGSKASCFAIALLKIPFTTLASDLVSEVGSSVLSGGHSDGLLNKDISDTVSWCTNLKRLWYWEFFQEYT